MDKINPQQFESLKKIVVVLGKKPEEVDEYNQNKFNENREIRVASAFKQMTTEKLLGGKCIQTNENGEITVLDLAGYFRWLTDFDPTFSRLSKSLRWLRNKLSGSIPPELGQLEVLMYLNPFRNLAYILEILT